MAESIDKAYARWRDAAIAFDRTASIDTIKEYLELDEAASDLIVAFVEERARLHKAVGDLAEATKRLNKKRLEFWQLCYDAGLFQKDATKPQVYGEVLSNSSHSIVGEWEDGQVVLHKEES
jgi:hypothetical protein